ncbi:MAG: hypothetical protein J5I50_11970 [Chitinophagaceae bacterium]|nr:hypothetical protein [Chitinophagaceae bacterium]
MRRLILLTVLVLFASLQGCKKEGNYNLVEATVVIDCTGTYLRVAKLDYAVCNEEKLASFENGEKVLASFTVIKDCKSLKPVTCYLYHPYESLVTVKQVKR